MYFTQRVVGNGSATVIFKGRVWKPLPSRAADSSVAESKVYFFKSILRGDLS